MLCNAFDAKWAQGNVQRYHAATWLKKCNRLMHLALSQFYRVGSPATNPFNALDDADDEYWEGPPSPAYDW